MKRITYREKIEQTHREAKATVVALAVTIAAWALLGFGLSSLDVQVFHTPIWVLGATVGVYVVSLVVVVVLRHAVFCDFDLDEHVPENQTAQAAAAGYTQEQTLQSGTQRHAQLGAQASTQPGVQSDTQPSCQVDTGGAR